MYIYMYICMYRYKYIYIYTNVKKHINIYLIGRSDRTTRIPSGVASPVTTNHASRGSVFGKLRNAGNLKIGT